MNTVFLAAYLIIRLPLSAEQAGLFTYRIHDDSVEITNYPVVAVGEVEIPAEISRDALSVTPSH